MRTYPILATPVHAGFPSPATDFVEDHLSLDELLVEHPEATYFVNVTGDSMVGFGIHNGDRLVVDRSLTPCDLQIVIVVLDDEFAVKQLCYTPKGTILRAGSPDYPDILVGPDQQLTIWGVARWSIHKL